MAGWIKIASALKASMTRLFYAVCLFLMSAAPSWGAGSGTAGDPFTTLSDAYNTASGRYHFDLGGGVFQADVDNSEGGGWVLVLQYVHKGGTNPLLDVRGTFPALSSAPLGTDESTDKNTWGHISNAVMARFTGDIELRWYGETSNHRRKIHFRSTEGDDYWRTGNGNASDIDTNFVALTGHSANIPSNAPNNYGNQGDYALTEFPYWLASNYHWGIRGGGNRWEVDDTSTTSDTIHRVWVRQAPTLVVNNTNDDGWGSLRQAITLANEASVGNEVTFNIPGTGPHRISLTSALPSIADAKISIDGTTQSGATCGTSDLTDRSLMIEIDGTNAGNVDGFTGTAFDFQLKGVSIINFQSHGINMSLTKSMFSCNHIGVDAQGLVAAPNLQGVYIAGGDGLSLGDGTVEGRNIISGNSSDGVFVTSATTATLILGNFIGLNRDGNAALGNGGDGVSIDGASGVNIGNGTDGGRNVISGNGQRGIEMINVDGVTVLGNYIGLTSDGIDESANGLDGIKASSTSQNVTIGGLSGEGNVIVSSNASTGDRGIHMSNAQGSNIIGNLVGLNASGTSTLGDGRVGIELSAGGMTSVVDSNIVGTYATGIRIGKHEDITIKNNLIGESAAGVDIGGTLEGISLTPGGSTSSSNFQIVDNIIANYGNEGVRISPHTNASLLSTVMKGNTIKSNGGAGLIMDGVIAISIGDGSEVGANSISNNTLAGISVESSTVAQILNNSIHSNGGLGIDLENDGVVNDNDAGGGDADTGANDLLNFPVINSFAGDGTTAVNYDFNLDVPSDANGYRIDFYKNSAADSSGHGEGETHLGFVDVAHAGGDLNFTGSFTASETVSVGNIISATTTRKTGASSYDITSEFAANQTATPPPDPLIVTSTADTFTLGTLRFAINHANQNAAEDNISFNIPGTGPHVISLTSSLLDINDPGVTIDGTTQTGASCGQLTAGTQHNLMIQIDLIGAGSGAKPIETAVADVTIKGLSITNAQSHAIKVKAGGNNFLLDCAYIGVAPDGVTPGSNAKQDNTNPAIRLTGISNATVRNSLISGNDDDSTDDGLRYESIAGGVIEGNIIGLNAAGTVKLGNGDDGIWIDGTTSGVTIGGTSSSDRNIISGNIGTGLYIEGSNNVDILGNYIGTNITGTAAVANGEHGISIDGGTSINIGNGSENGRNIISGNSQSAIEMISTQDVSINDNYIGLSADGMTNIGTGSVNSNSSDAIYASSGTTTNTIVSNNTIGGAAYNAIYLHSSAALSTGTVIQGNVIGFLADGITAAPVYGNGIAIHRQSGPVLGGAGPSEGNQIGNTSVHLGIYISSSPNAQVLGNSIGLAANGTSAPINRAGVWVRDSAGVAIGDGTSAGANIITNSGEAGVEILNQSSTSVVSVIGNSIYDNGEIGIDLSADGVTNNDTGGGDGDSGPNDLLNFPVINSFGSNGSGAMAYDFDLDVPSNGNGYRIDFYKSSAIDSSGYGEGEVHLGFVDVAHSGGDLNFTGSFTPNAAVVQGDNISATATRKTGASSYDITSEFSFTITSSAATELAGAKSVSVYDPLGEGLYNLPGNDALSSLTITNTGAGSSDADTIFIVESLPSELEFYNGDMDDGGPETNPVSFAQTGGAGLTFTYANDVKFSNGLTKPSAMNECSYSPSSGYDSNVTYICFNPKGAMAAGDPDPTFTLTYRARIK